MSERPHITTTTDPFVPAGSPVNVDFVSDGPAGAVKPIEWYTRYAARKVLANAMIRRVRRDVLRLPPATRRRAG